MMPRTTVEVFGPLSKISAHPVDSLAAGAASAILDKYQHPIPEGDYVLNHRVSSSPRR
jgi:hypothetical protein